MTFTSAPISVKDAAATTKTMVAFTDGVNNAFAHAVLDDTGALIGPATADNQTTANTLLSTISSLLGAALSVVANVTQVGGAALSLGQKAAAASVPVAIASDQSTIPVAMTANTSGGTSTFCANGAGGGNALLTNIAVAVKASAGNLYGFDFVNTGAAAAYVQIFDVAAASVTVGTTLPKLSKWVPAGGSWEEKFSGEGKITFGTAITLAATTTPSGGTAPATGILANVTFK